MYFLEILYKYLENSSFCSSRKYGEPNKINDGEAKLAKEDSCREKCENTEKNLTMISDRVELDRVTELIESWSSWKKGGHGSASNRDGLGGGFGTMREWRIYRLWIQRGLNWREGPS